MKLVIDSNVLFTYFWKQSVCSSILQHSIECYAPEYALEEIKKYEHHIKKKTGCSQQEFSQRRKELVQRVAFIPEQEYSTDYKKLHTHLKNLPQHHYQELLKDIDFLTLAHILHLPLWSNDNLLKQQKLITVVTTKELLELLEEIL